mgnify:CR=1 FL=1
MVDSGLCPPNHITVGPSTNLTGPFFIGLNTFSSILFVPGVVIPHLSNPVYSEGKTNLHLGIKPFLVASATRAVLAQRLVRRYCSKCIEPHEPHQAELDSLEITAEQAESAKFMRGAGCKVCEDSGYKGRMGLFEVYSLDDTDRRMIIDGASTAELRDHAMANGMHTLRMDGVRKVTNGMTSVKEVLRSTSSDEKD